MFDLCHHALAVYADIDNCYGMSHMEVVKKFERKKQKKTIIVFDYKRIQVN